MRTPAGGVRAAIYLRVSLDLTGEGLAVSRQREDCRAIAAARGWSVVEEYVDNSASASDARKRRKAYDRMVADYAAGRFDALVCWDLDRLTRQPRQLEDWIDAATDRGLRLVTANGEADLTTDAGRLFARIKAGVARSEVERKAARQARANRQRAESGKPPGGVRLTGYTLDGKLKAREAQLVASMFSGFAGGESLRGLCTRLEAAGHRTRHGKPWNPSTVRTILTNPRYAGQAIYQGQPIEVPAGWPAIVSPEEYGVVQAMLRDPRRRTVHSTDRRHLGSSLYRCGVCGQLVRAWSGNRYRCPAGCLTRAQGPIDDLVIRVTEGRLASPDLAELLAGAPTDQAAELAQEACRLTARLNTIGADYDAGLIDGHRYREAREKVLAQLRRVEQRQAAAAAAAGPGSILGAPDPAAAFRGSSLMMRRAVVDALLEVTLHPAPRGRKGFDPRSVDLTWRTA